MAPIKYVSLLLPWPSAALSPNSRDRWAKIRAAKEARELALLETALQQPEARFPGFVGRLEIEYRFYPPDRKYYDDDNLIGRMKSWRDGIFDRIEVNDHLVRRTVCEVCEVRKGGAVEVTIRSL